MKHLALLTLTAAVLCPAVGFAQTEFFVATNGRDSNPGTQEQPFATLTRARDAVRALKRRAALPAGGLTVWIRAGRYPIVKSVQLRAEDSGKPDAPIAYRNYANEEVRLVGGVELRDFQAVRDPAVLARINPLYRGKILATDLRAQGITDFGELAPCGFGKSHPAALELFFRDQPMTLARWPNQGFVAVSGLPKGEGAKIVDIHSTGSSAGKFYYADDRPERWTKAEDIWLHGYWRYDWADNYVKVKSIDAGTRLITTEGSPGTYGVAPGQRYYYLNLLEELDQPGEWYLDRRTGILYFWPPAPIEAGSVYASLLSEPLVSLQDVSDVRLQGLILEDSRGNGVEMHAGARGLVAGCTLRNLGNYGVVIDGGTGNGVAGSDIYAAGEGGIQLRGGDRRTLQSAGNFSRNNHIHHFNRWVRTYCPAVLVSGVGNQVTHNLIHDSPHNAIQISGNDHLIELNEIHHVAQETGDVGAFYMGRSWTERGNVVRYNFFHDIGAPGRDVRTVYLDDCASGTTVFGNIFYRTTRGVIIGGGRDNHIANNVFIESEPAIRVDDRCMSSREVWRNMVGTTMKQDLEAIRQEEALYLKRYPALAEVKTYYTQHAGIPPAGNVIEHNIALGATWLSFHLEDPADLPLFAVRDNLLEQDPGFTDPAHLDFHIGQGSPVYSTGFQQIPVAEIGLYRDPYRQTLR